MVSSNDYYFSSAELEKDLALRISTPTVIVTRKDVWDQHQLLDYYQIDSKEYVKIYEILKVPDVLEEAMENYFQPTKFMTCKELETYLKKEGFEHNTDLDDLMDDYLALGR